MGPWLLAGAAGTVKPATADGDGKTETMTTEVKIMAVLTAHPGKVEALRALLDDMAPACRAEPGNLRWDIWQDQADPGRFILDELYVDNAAVADHRLTPHFQHYVSRINDLAARSAFVLDAVDIA